jgi:hypothetical protein
MLCWVKETINEQPWYLAILTIHLSTALKLIALPHAFLHSLLYQPSRRTSHLKLALANLHLVKAQNTGTVDSTVTGGIGVVVVAIVVGVAGATP